MLLEKRQEREENTVNRQKLLALVLALTLCLGLTTLPAAAAGITRTKTYTPGQFTDVAADAWYATSVKDAYELGLMSGSGATTFNPGGMFTLAEAATIAARMHNLYIGGNGIISATSGAWYQGAVDYCVQNKIFAAGDFDDFTRNANRAEMAQLMAAALPDSAWAAINTVTALPDVSAGTDHSDAIFKLYNAGVFTGSDQYGMFQPYANITRAEVAAIAARCADTSQRKVLSLTPLSQRQAPEIIGGYVSRVVGSNQDTYSNSGSPNSEDTKMSNGRLPFKDPETKKYGYLDGNGNVAISAVYDEVANFFDGYAMVKQNGKWGMIDTSGQVTLPLNNSNLEYYYTKWSVPKFAPGTYIAHGPNGYGLVRNGRLVSADDYSSMMPCDSVPGGSVTDNKRVLVSRDGKYGVIDTNGRELVPCQYSCYVHTGTYYNMSTYQYTCRSAGNNGYLLAVTRTDELLSSYDNREAKYLCTGALYNSEGKLLRENTWEGTVCRKRSEKFDTGLKTWWAYYPESDRSVEVAVNNPLYAAKEGEKWAVGDSNGLITEALYDNVTLVKDANFAIVTYGNLYGLVGLAGEIFTPGTYDSFEAKDQYVIVKKDDKIVGVADVTGMLPGGVEDYFPKTEDKPASSEKQAEYQIQYNDAGKPCLYYGSYELGWTPVIEHYRNSMYYDEIKDIGEGYYACRYNTTWYLIHA